jgi:VWFA-related protein
LRYEALTFVTVGVVLWPLMVAAQPDAKPTFRAATSVVELAVAVTDAAGRPVADLQEGDFEVLEDGRPQRLTAFRRLAAPPVAAPAATGDLRLSTAYSNQIDADAPLFVLLLDDLNTSPYDAPRVVRAAESVLDALPADALVAILTTSGVSGTLVTPERVNAQHRAGAKAFAGRLLLQAPGGKGLGPQVTASAVNTPCTSGAGAESPDCLDPTRPARRAAALGTAASILGRAGARRKALFWFTSEAGASPLDPQGQGRGQRQALMQALNSDVAVYVFDPRENAPASQVDEARPDVRAGGRMRVGTADTVFSGTGGSVMALNADDLSAVPLTQFTRETGGRYVTAANNLGAFAAEVVRQNSTAYLLAYESEATTPGRHALEVRVKRRDTRVFARRGFVLPPAGSASVEPQPSLLGRLITGSVPQGQLPVTVHVQPEYDAAGVQHAAVVIEIEKDDAAPVDVLVATIGEGGHVLEQQQFRVEPPGPGVPWEIGTTMRADGQTSQLRVAAATRDGARSGLVLATLSRAAAPVALSGPVLRVEGGGGPTRSVITGQPVSLVAFASGEAARPTSPTQFHLLRDGSVVTQVAATRLELNSGVVRWQAQVEAPAPGAYWVVADIGQPPRRSDAVRLRVRADARPGASSPSAERSTTADRAAAPPAVASVTFTVVSAGQAPSGPSATYAVDSDGAWKELWMRLSGSAPQPQVDFDEATVFAVVLDESDHSPEVTSVLQQDGDAVVRWRAVPGAAPGRGSPRYVVVAIDSPVSGARFERVP